MVFWQNCKISNCFWNLLLQLLFNKLPLNCPTETYVLKDQHELCLTEKVTLDV